MARKEHDRLYPSGRDGFVAVMRAMMGPIPIVGPGIAELVSSVIPNQRWERVVDYMVSMDEELRKLKDEVGNKIIHDPLKIDLFEDGLSQAARAVSKERMEYIKKCVLDGMTDETLEYLESKRIMRILNELDDAEIIYLAGQFRDWSEEWKKKHENLLTAPEQRDRKAIFDAAKRHLLQLGLLWEANRFEGDKYRIVTDLGRLLLFRIGVIESRDLPGAEHS